MLATKTRQTARVAMASTQAIKPQNKSLLGPLIGLGLCVAGGAMLLNNQSMNVPDTTPPDTGPECDPSVKSMTPDEVAKFIEFELNAMGNEGCSTEQGIAEMLNWSYDRYDETTILEITNQLIEALQKHYWRFASPRVTKAELHLSPRAYDRVVDRMKSQPGYQITLRDPAFQGIKGISTRHACCS